MRHALRVAHCLTCTGCKSELAGCAQGVLSWVAQPQPGRDPPRFEARLYDTLFKSEDPSSLDTDWLQDLNPESETVLQVCSLTCAQSACLWSQLQHFAMGQTLSLVTEKHSCKGAASELL